MRRKRAILRLLARCNQVKIGLNSRAAIFRGNLITHENYEIKVDKRKCLEANSAVVQMEDTLEMSNRNDEAYCDFFKSRVKYGSVSHP